MWGHGSVALNERDVSPDTPEDGVGCASWLQGGAEIEGLGRLENRVVSEGA